MSAMVCRKWCVCVCVRRVVQGSVGGLNTVEDSHGVGDGVPKKVGVGRGMQGSGGGLNTVEDSHGVGDGVPKVVGLGRGVHI